MPLIAVINKSTLVKDADIDTMCKAIQVQMDTMVAPAWQVQAPTVRFYADAAKVPGWAWLITMVDDEASVPGALGYHTITNAGTVQGFIMAKPILDAGGVVLFDPTNASNYSVSGCLSHECLETLIDRWCSGWASSSDGTLYGLEICDPVENNNIVVIVNGQSVFVSDFVYPSWFCSETTDKNKPFNHLNTLSSAFTLAKNGYCVKGTDMSNVQQVFGELMPEWRREQKRKYGRGATKVRFAKKGFWSRFVSWLKN
jgi:hypothetical protein